MKKNNYLIVFCLLLLSFQTSVLAQQNSRQSTAQNNDTTLQAPLQLFPILGLGKPYPDRIALRWSAGDADMLRALLHDGVLIDRLRIGANNLAIGGWERITPDTVRAWSMSKFEQRVTERDTALLIVAQAIYGKPEYPAEIDVIELAKMQRLERENRLLTINLYSGLSEVAAQAAGFAFDDKIRVDTTMNYVYKIYPAKVRPHIVIPDTGYVFVAGVDLNRHPVYEGLETVSRDGAISLQWPAEYQEFTGFFVDRSDDNVNFKRLNNVVYLPSIDSVYTGAKYSYVDSVQNNKDYYYRLTGVTPFGERIQFLNTARGKGMDLTPPSAPFFSHTETGNKVTFSWKKPIEEDLLGYHIVRGKDVQTIDTVLTASQMLNPNTLEYSILKSEQPYSSFYRLMVMDKDFNSEFSDPVYIFTVDTIPPAAPRILSGNIDSTGVVTVHWAHLENEPDLRGYKVLFANAEDHDFATESNIIPDTVYTFNTTLHTLTPELFVKVIAVDANYNHGAPSEAFRLIRPDTIPPRTPVILGYENTPSGIRINWSPSIDLGFDYFEVLKRVDGKDWEQLSKTKELNYFDSNVSPRLMYEYTLVEVDLSGNRSAMAFPQTVVASAALDEDIKLTKLYTQQTETILLSWTKPVRPAHAIVIYKDEGQGLTMYERVEAGQTEFSEKAKPNTLYGISVVYSDNSESPVIKSN